MKIALPRPLREAFFTRRSARNGLFTCDRAAVHLPIALLVLLALAPALHAQPEAALRLRAVGDVMMGTDFPSPDYLPPDDGRGYFDAVAPMLRDADLTFANLEGPLLDGGTTDKCRPGANCYAFRTPARYARHLAATGLDLASLANNHAHDFGEAGRASTIHLLDSLGIAWSGPPGTVASAVHDGRRVAMIAFHTADHSNYLNDHAAAARLVRRTARAHDLVVVSFHGGAEGRAALHVPDTMEVFYGEERGHLRRFARTVIDAGADLVLGHGPHVVRGMELYRGRLVAYSLGNFATYGRFSLGGPLGLGLVLEAVLDAEGRFVTGRLLPTRLVGEGVPEPDPARRTIRLVRALTRADFPETGVRVLPGGRLADPRRTDALRPRLPTPAPMPRPTRLR